MTGSGTAASPPSASSPPPQSPPVDFENYNFFSRRLLSFMITLFSRLNLGENNVSWNVVRLLVRDGFYVRFDTNSDHVVNDGQIVCFSCRSIAYGSFNEFVHAVFNVYHNRDMNEEDQRLGVVMIESDFYHLPHRRLCERAALSHNDLPSYSDLMSIRRLFAVAYASNRAAVRQNGEYECRVCFSRPTDVACLPCGHVYACFDCLLRSLQTTASGAPVGCFVCRTPVSSLQQLYFA
jgi:hypothetical protein